MVPIEAYLYRMVINAALNHIEKEEEYTRLEYHTAADIETETDENNAIEDRENKVKKCG